MILSYHAKILCLKICIAVTPAEKQNIKLLYGMEF